MADPLPPQQVQPNCTYYPIDQEFPVYCNVDYENAYCCDVIGRFESDEFVGCLPEFDYCQIGPAGCNMNFPVYNDEGQPMYKTALGGNTKSAWVRIAFQQYDIGTNLEDPVATWKTILTMGNLSQPFNDEKCMATIQGFQYGWGTTNEGNRCRITILDQKGSDFQQWIQRMGINPEGDAVPVQGKYRMKVQFGWYVTGGATTDICGQPPQPLLKIQNEFGDLQSTPAAEGFNSAYIICSPVMYFLTDWINVHWADGKFKYELEGVDLLVRAQENLVSKTYGKDTKKMYFTKAVKLLGQMSFPPFRVEFKALNALGEVVDMQFAARDGNFEDRTCNSGSDCEKYNFDCEGWGPYDVWDTNASTPLTVIQNWIKKGVFAQDLTGKITSSGGKTGITMNYDPTYKFNDYPADTDPCDLPCTSAAPQYGRLILWANAIPYCQGNFNDNEINARLKAVYVVNGGNCSPVISFNPSFRWRQTAAMKGGGAANPGITNTITGGVLGSAIVAMANQVIGMVKANCAIASTPGLKRQAVPMATRSTAVTPNPPQMTQEAVYHQIMTNMAIGVIEATLRIQGDPSYWLCTPVAGMGRCVGIVFINPYFLVHGATSNDCPVWASNDPDNPDEQFKSICNELLTNKGWFVMGVDHQIKDGQYVTELRLRLVAPGAELNPAGSVVNLGGWADSPTSGGLPLPYGGQFGCLNKNLVGSAAAGWALQSGSWVGGGTLCGNNYTDTGAEPLPPD